MQISKRIVSITLVIVVIVCLSAPCFADPVSAMTFGEAFTAGASAYAVANGFSYGFSHNGFSSSVTNPSSWNEFDSMFDDLYEEYYEQADPSKYDKLPLPNKWSDSYHSTEWYHLVNEDVEPYAKHSSGSFAPITEVQLGSDIVEIYDDYFNWLLGDKLGITRDASTGVFVLPNASYSVPLASFTLPVGVESSSLLPYSSDKSVRYNNCYLFVKSSSRFVGIFSDERNNTEIIKLFPFHVGDTIYVVSSINWYSAGYRFVLADCSINYSGANKTNLGYNSSVNYDSDYGLYYCTTGGYTLSGTWYIPEFDSLATAFSFVGIVIDTGNSGSFELNLISSDGVVDIPDSSDENYEPAPLPAPLGIPWHNSYSNDNDLLLQDILDTALENDLVAVDEIADPEPVEPVMPPFLPANFPSINFSFSGIWYYVTRWINSVGAGLSFFNSIWNSIPPAMFYPIFGTAVAVLVIDVFRRFFA